MPQTRQTLRADRRRPMVSQVGVVKVAAKAGATRVQGRWRGSEAGEVRREWSPGPGRTPAEALPITATLLLDEELSKRVTLSKRRGPASPHQSPPTPYPVPLVLS